MKYGLNTWGRRRRWASVQRVLKGVGSWVGRFGRVAVLVMTCWSIQGLVYVASIESAKGAKSVEKPKAFERSILESFRHGNSAIWMDEKLYCEAPILNGEKTFCGTSDIPCGLGQDKKRSEAFAELASKN